jgi:hypothetical protein
MSIKPVLTDTHQISCAQYIVFMPLFYLYHPSHHIVVSLMFTEDEYTVFDNQVSFVTVCLVLSGASAPTEAAIWANISTNPISASTGEQGLLGSLWGQNFKIPEHL